VGFAISDENNKLVLVLYLSIMVKPVWFLLGIYLGEVFTAGTNQRKWNILEPDQFVAKGHAEHLSLKFNYCFLK
jgi:hypothetical protein